ncbi:MAG: (d)CMP kinase [Casimicrobiaceae bacterium]|nr:(d)CMP kinase [Casimicrobiaceae bacterium]MDW8311694.1 (d)CMP kinase [Burkholderiales bacterium]
MSSSNPCPIITIDGPTASGKGTVSRMLAAELGFHYLDSGAIYRAFALAAQVCDPSNIRCLENKARVLSLDFRDAKVWADAVDVTEAIRTEEVGLRASQLSAIPEVRAALLARQRAFARPPGLVADGRDMGTVVFPDAALKVFLTASVQERARRRAAQLGQSDLAAIRQRLLARDTQDRTRTASPLRPAADAVILDNAGHSAERTVEAILRLWQTRTSAVHPKR